MIYTCGIHHPLFEEVSPEWVYRYFRMEEYIQLDTETFGFDPHTKPLMCMQLGRYEDQFVIHPDSVKDFRALLETKVLIMHNCKFDLKFLFKQNIFPIKVYDTMLAEAVIHCGNPTIRKNLARVAKDRLGIELDKSIREGIWNEGLTERVIRYAADDVKYLEQIRDSQAEDLQRLDLADTLELENDFTLPLAYIEFCGFKLDEEKWKTKMAKDEIALEKAKEGLMDYLENNGMRHYLSYQGDLFSDTCRSCTVNWASNPEVKRFFKKLGIPLEVKVKGKLKETVEATHLVKFAPRFPIITPYIAYKEAEKVCSTYGASFLHQINPATGRLHTNFQQIKDTGRISSGSKNKETGERYPNMQNIPADKETRACFVAEEGNTLIIGDFSAQEAVVLANKSLDENLLEFYDNGLGDMHSFVASKIFPELEGLTIEDIKTNHKEKRQVAKIAGFAMVYGGTGKTIADQLGFTEEKGNEVYEAYFKAFPGLKDYFLKVQDEGLDKGYILIDDVVRRKSFIYNHNEYLGLKKRLNRSFWDKWKVLKAQKAVNIENPQYEEYRMLISKFFKIKGEIQRKALNFPIQGASASITKMATIYVFQWIRNKKLLGKVKIVNTVHDELCLEAPLELADLVTEKVEHFMIKAGESFCKRVKLGADVHNCNYWKK